MNLRDISSLRIAKNGETSLQASKWLDFQLLIDEQEMQNLFDELGDFEIFKVGCVCAFDEGQVSREDFLNSYRSYVESLKAGKLPDETTFRSHFSSVFTVYRDPIYQIPIAGNRRILRVNQPVVQLQVNQIAYSEADCKFRALVFGKESILWGLQFSYPQLFQDANKEVFKTLNDSRFLNTALFRKLQFWVRQYTIPTPFVVQGKVIHVPMRLGKQCLSWINRHPQLTQHHLEVRYTTNASSG